MATTQEQIESQRQAIESQRLELESARKSNLLRQARELRSSGLAERGQRKAVAGRISKAGGELTGAETEFETEVSKVAPEYGKESYVETEYQKAKKILDEKIEKENQRIKDYEDKIAKAREKERQDRDYDAGDRIDRWEDDISEIRARISGYSKAYGDKATTIKNVNTGYADSLANYEENYRQARNKQLAEFRELKNKPEFTSQLATLGLADKKNISLSDYERGVTKYNQNVAYLKQLGKWSEKVGIENIPQFARDKLGIPTMPEGEKLVIGYENSMPVVRGIESSAFQQSLSTDSYNKRIEEANARIRNAQKPFISTTVLTSSGLQSKKIEFTIPEVKQLPVSTYTAAPEKNIFQQIQQRISNVFTEKFRVTPSEVGENIKQVGRDAVTGLKVIGDVAETGLYLKDTRVSPETLSSLSSFAQVNPVELYKVSKEAEDIKNIDEKIKQLNRQYNLGKIDEETYNERYNNLVNKYNRATSVRQVLETSPYLSEKQKTFTSFAMTTSDIVPYIGAAFAPPLALGLGAVNIYSGSKDIKNEEYLSGGIKVAVGGLSLFSGVKALVPKAPATQLTAPAVPSLASKVWTGTKLTAGLGLVGYTGYSTYKRTGSIGATIGTVGGLITTPLIIGGISRQISSRVPKPQYFGKSEREYMKLVQTQRRVENIIAEQRTMSQSLWRERVKVLEGLDRNVASQIKRYGVDIPIKSATESIIKFGNVRTLGGGIQETSKKEAIKVLETVLPIKDKALKTSDVRITFRDTTISQRPRIELLGGKQLPPPSKQFSKFFPDLVQTQKVREFQAVLGVKTKGGYTGFATSWTKDLVTGRVNKPTEFIKITAGKKTAIAEVFSAARTSTSRQGEFIIKNYPSARLKDIQVFKLGKPKIIAKVQTPTGEIFEIRETVVTSGVTKVKPIRLAPFEFAEKLNTRTRLDSVKNLGKFYTTKDKTLELIKYSNIQGRQDITIVGTFADKKTAIKATETLFRQFKLGGTGNTEFLNPKGAEFVEGSWVSTKALPDIGLVVLKDKGGEQIVKTVTQQVLETKTATPDIFVKTDVAKTIVTPRVSSAELTEYWGSGQYETTQFGLPSIGALSMNLQNIKTNLVLQPIAIKEQTQIKNLVLQPIAIKEQTQIKNLVLEGKMIKPIERLEVKASQKLLIKPLQRLNVKQILQTKIKTVQKIQPKTRTPTTKVPRTIKIPSVPSILLSSGKLQKMASTIGTEEFEAIAFKLGKEVSVKKGSKEGAAKGLRDFLTGNLSASGFLKNIRTGEKIRAEETGLLRDLTFRKSRSSHYLVVEKKERRLRKGTTGKEVQYFRKVKGSKL